MVKKCVKDDVRTQLDGELKIDSHVIAILIVMKCFTIVVQIISTIVVQIILRLSETKRNIQEEIRLGMY